MQWLEKVRGYSTERKLRLIWTVVAVVVVLLLILWAFTSQIGKVKNGDTSFFGAMGQSFHNFSSGVNSK